MKIRLFILEKKDNFYITMKDEILDKEYDKCFDHLALNAIDNYKNAFEDTEETLCISMNADTGELRYLVRRDKEDPYKYIQASDYIYRIRKQLPEGLLYVFKDAFVGTDFKLD